MQRLTHSILEDVPADSVSAGLRVWPAVRVFVVPHYLTSFTYISSVRLASGKVYCTDMRVLVDLLSSLGLRMENVGTLTGGSQASDPW